MTLIPGLSYTHQRRQRQTGGRSAVEPLTPSVGSNPAPFLPRLSSKLDRFGRIKAVI